MTGAVCLFVLALVLWALSAGSAVLTVVGSLFHAPWVLTALLAALALFVVGGAAVFGAAFRILRGA